MLTYSGLGFTTQVFLLAQQAFLPAEPSPWFLIIWYLIISRQYFGIFCVLSPCFSLTTYRCSPPPLLWPSDLCIQGSTPWKDFGRKFHSELTRNWLVVVKLKNVTTICLAWVVCQVSWVIRRVFLACEGWEFTAAVKYSASLSLQQKFLEWIFHKHCEMTLYNFSCHLQNTWSLIYLQGTIQHTLGKWDIQACFQNFISSQLEIRCFQTEKKMYNAYSFLCIYI